MHAKELHKHTFLSKTLNYEIVCDGVNLDDLAIIGLVFKQQKKREFISLSRANYTKKDIRDISKALGLWWDKPAQPCLSSRFPYGHQITAKRLNMVEKLKNILKKRDIK